MKEHFPGSLPVPKIDLSKENVADPLGSTGRFNEPVLVDARPWINLTMLDLAFRQFGKHKCPGPDGFRPLLLCHLPEKARQALIDIYNAVIELQYTPLLWRGSDIVFLTKPGKQDYTDKRAFRPISLMPFLFKALERLIKWYMESHCSDFHPNQHAFRKGHCTENALSRMKDIIESSLTKGHVALAVFLDIKGEFDNLSSKTIAQRMLDHNVDKDIVGWIKNYLGHRYCKVKGSNQFFPTYHRDGTRRNPFPITMELCNGLVPSEIQ
jgi:hypothetical protein